jgi:hypothetical protein
VRTIGKSLLAAASIALACVGSARAQVEIPTVGQPSPFYGAASKQLKLETSATPTELTIDDSILFMIRASKLLNAADVQRPDLGGIEEFRRDFQVDDEPTTEREPDGTRIFRYRLRPRQASVFKVPGFVFPYYDPNQPQPADRPDLPFRKARAEAIAIHVHKAAPPPLKIVPLDIPTFAENLSTRSIELSGWIWWLAAAIPPTLAVGWCLIWRTMNPVGDRLARRRRSRAARIALRTLQALGRHPPPDPAIVVGCVAVYLAERFDLPGIFRTPGDLGFHLENANASEETVVGCAAFVQDADQARFAPSPSDSGDSLVAKAERLILQLEGES